MRTECVMRGQMDDSLVNHTHKTGGKGGKCRSMVNMCVVGVAVYSVLLL